MGGNCQSGLQRHCPSLPAASEGYSCPIFLPTTRITSLSGFDILIGAWWYLCCCLVAFSVAQSCPTPCDPTDCSMPGLPVPHHFSEFAQVHVHWDGDAIQPSHPLSSSSPSAVNLSQHQGLGLVVYCGFNWHFPSEKLCYHLFWCSLAVSIIFFAKMFWF